MEQKGELEDVEADILLEERVGDAEGGRIQEEQEVFPLGGAVGGGEKAEEERSHEDQDLEEARFHLLEGDAERPGPGLIAEERDLATGEARSGDCRRG